MSTFGARVFSPRLLAAALVCVLASAAMAAPLPSGPANLTFQGRLTDPAGLPLAGSVTLTFRIFDSTALDAEPLWTSFPGSVALQDGLFSVVLGDSPTFASAG